jgi:hypothetical protein
VVPSRHSGGAGQGSVLVRKADNICPESLNSAVGVGASGGLGQSYKSKSQMMVAALRPSTAIAIHSRYPICQFVLIPDDERSRHAIFLDPDQGSGRTP